MITKFKKNIFGFEDVCLSILMLIAYFLFFREPYVQLLNTGHSFEIAIKKIFSVMFNGMDFIIIFGMSVAMIVSVVNEKIASEIELHHHISLENENIRLDGSKRGYGEYLLNLSNPFLLGSKIMELRE